MRTILVLPWWWCLGILVQDIVAIDVPEVEVLVSMLHRLMTGVLSVTKKLLGILPIYVGGRMRLTKNLMAPELVPDREGNVLGIELHDCDFTSSQGQTPASIAEDGCCLVEYMPKAVYVKFDDLQMQVQTPYHAASIQFGLLAHFRLPNLSTESRRPAYYVMISRVRILDQILCHGLPEDKFYKPALRQNYSKPWIPFLWPKCRGHMRSADWRLCGETEGLAMRNPPEHSFPSLCANGQLFLLGCDEERAVLLHCSMHSMDSKMNIVFERLRNLLKHWLHFGSSWEDTLHFLTDMKYILDLCEKLNKAEGGREDADVKAILQEARSGRVH